MVCTKDYKATDSKKPEAIWSYVAVYGTSKALKDAAYTIHAAGLDRYKFHPVDTNSTEFTALLALTEHTDLFVVPFDYHYETSAYSSLFSAAFAAVVEDYRKYCAMQKPNTVFYHDARFDYPIDLALYNQTDETSYQHKEPATMPTAKSATPNTTKPRATKHFYVIHSGNVVSMPHPSYSDARVHADTLAQKSPGFVYAIAEVIDARCAVISKPKSIKLAKPDPEPEPELEA